jgi:superfamily II DNA or RNA helicase
MTNFKLRPYQLEAVEQAHKHIGSSEKEIILVASTSWGKSAWISTMAQQLDGEIVILVTFTPLIQQIADTLSAIGTEYSILKAGREKDFDPSKRIHICMAQTLYARIDTMDIGCKTLIIDEYHNSYRTKRSQAIIDKLNPEITLGCTATPYNEAGFALSNNAQIIDTAPVEQLEEQGYLCKTKYFVPKWSELVDYDNAKKSGGDYTSTSIESITSKPSHLALVVESMNKLDAKNKKTIVFCSNTDHCDTVCRTLREAGYLAQSTHSKIDKRNNEAIMEAYINNTEYVHIKPKVKKSELEAGSLFDDAIEEPKPEQIHCLVSVSKLTTGFSCSDIQLGVLLRKSLVRSLFVQMAGRVKRIFPNKQYAEILDCAQMVQSHGFPEDYYEPPHRVDDSLANKHTITKLQAEHALPNLRIACDDELNEPTTLSHYEAKLIELHNSKLRLTEMNNEQLANRFRIEQDIKPLFATIAVMFDKFLCKDMFDKWGNPSRGYVSNKSKEVVGFCNPRSIEYLAEPWVEAFEWLPEYYISKYTKSLKTRVTNIFKNADKNGIPSIYSLPFFISYLMEDDESELDYLDCRPHVEPEHVECEIEYKTITAEDDDMDLSNCPF